MFLAVGVGIQGESFHMRDFPDDSRAQGETCMKEVLELRHHLAYRDDVLLFILIKTGTS
jgi:hypothetical protein